MFDKILQVIEFEKQLLIDLINIMKLQQKALVKLDITKLAELSNNQEELSRKIRSIELSRINMIASLLKISKAEASSITMTELSKLVNQNEALRILGLRDEMKELGTQFNNLTITNRLLANRAKSSFANILSILTNGNNQIYNVKI
ncbi:MAG: flagellar export chaperone FlgN [Candidatus Kapaibacteriota bacterium]